VETFPQMPATDLTKNTSRPSCLRGRERYLGGERKGEVGVGFEGEKTLKTVRHQGRNEKGKRTPCLNPNEQRRGGNNKGEPRETREKKGSGVRGEESGTEIA